MDAIAQCIMLDQSREVCWENSEFVFISICPQRDCFLSGKAKLIHAAAPAIGEYGGRAQHVLNFVITVLQEFGEALCSVGFTHAAVLARVQRKRFVFKEDEL